ncbi:hypothetical protein GPECTOR_18g77 [Gonium pectorale]|uniref:Uncharacterized protein n=1 Tax=Gonium pectorale TaxID=33097 RepID=A0A150GJW9_GONPE|nr:hypothetical protein GPECTOR_18g77 [Gonium pectorale]|eukprot:KXZ50101.1 hypothetical protein GPECTOR_18g77 [Gonium pectorale]
MGASPFRCQDHLCLGRVSLHPDSPPLDLAARIVDIQKVLPAEYVITGVPPQLRSSAIGHWLAKAQPWAAGRPALALANLAGAAMWSAAGSPPPAPAAGHPGLGPEERWHRRLEENPEKVIQEYEDCMIEAAENRIREEMARETQKRIEDAREKIQEEVRQIWVRRRQSEEEQSDAYLEHTRIGLNNLEKMGETELSEWLRTLPMRVASVVKRSANAKKPRLKSPRNQEEE